MRTALISDIHGNYAGLLAVLSDISQQCCNRILCLGDLVDGGPQDAEVVQIIRERSIPVVQGNHDECPNVVLSREDETYLQALPDAIIEDDIIYTHTSPRKRKSKIVEEVEAWNVFEEVTYHRVFVGDIHIPLIFGEKCSHRFTASSYPISYVDEFQFAPDDRYIICVGAVGYSRDAHNWLRYAIFDSEFDTLTFHAPEGPLLTF